MTTEKERRPKGTGTIVRRGERCFCRWRQAGKSIQKRVKSEHAAKRILARVEDFVEDGAELPEAIRVALDEPEPEPVRRLTLAKAIEAYLDEREARLKNRTQRQRKRDRVRPGALRDAPFAHMELGSFGTGDVRLWAAERLRSGIADGTVLNEISVGSAVVSWAHDLELVDEDWNPFLKARRSITRKGVTRKERTALTREELVTLDRAVRDVTPEFYDFWLALVTTGWRFNEVASLCWRDVTLEPEPGYLECRPAVEKTSKRKRAYLAPQLRALLSRSDGNVVRSDLAPVFMRPAYRNWPAAPWRHQSALGRLRCALGACVEGKTIPAWKRDGTDEYLPFDNHSIRHTTRSLLNALGHDDHAINEVLGHDSADSVRRYTHVYADAMVRIAEDMGALLAG